MKKQISFYVPLAEWRKLREEAAARGVAITTLCAERLGLTVPGEAAPRKSPPTRH